MAATSLEPPTLHQVLAVALLLKKRTAAAVSEAQERCTQLERELEALRSATAAAPAPPPPPLAQVTATLPSTQPSAGPPAPATPEAALQPAIESLALWHMAAATLPPALQPALAQAQRYLLVGELQRGSLPGRLPVAAALQRTPVRAFLELASDILQTHAAATGAAAAAAPSPLATQQHTRVQLSPAHGVLLASATACLVHLCDQPGHTVVHSDFETLQRFCGMLLRLAATQSPEPATPTPDQLAQPSGQGQCPAAATPEPMPAGAVDLQQPSYGVAQAVLAALRQSASAGIILLSSCAMATRDSMEELVVAVVGEQLPPQSGSGGALGSGGSWGQSGRAAAVGAAEDARLLHRFMQLSAQASAALRLLPQWVEASLFDEPEFYQVGGGGRRMHGYCSAVDGEALLAGRQAHSGSSLCHVCTVPLYCRA